MENQENLVGGKAVFEEKTWEDVSALVTAQNGKAAGTRCMGRKYPPITAGLEHEIHDSR